MGIKRKVEIERGRRISIYVPQNLPDNVFEFIKNCKNINRTIWEILTIYINGIESDKEKFRGDGIKDLEKKIAKMILEYEEKNRD